MKKSGIHGNIALAGRAPRARAFSLVEIMVSLVIVSIIVMTVGNIFDQASDSWHAGMNSAEVNNSGRAVLDLLATELTQAFAGQIEYVFDAESNANVSINFYQDAKDSVYFTCFNRPPEHDVRELRGVHYYKNGSRLMRSACTKSINPYTAAPSTWGSGDTDVLLPNVITFEIQAYDNDLTPYSGASLNTNALPPFVDVLIELMADSSKITYDRIPAGAAKDAYRAANIRVFATRVYFRNRMGFMPR